MPGKDLLPRLLFVAACAFFAFLYGFAASHFGWFPAGFMARALDQAAVVGTAPAVDLHHLHPARHQLRGVVREDGAGGPGLTLITSYWQDDGWQPGLRLIDADGTVLHRWNANPLRIWPESPHRDGLRGNFHLASNYVHGAHLFENGDVLFNIEYLGLCRLDAAGEVIWRLDRRTHHSVTPNERGNFWVSAARWIDDPQEVVTRFPGLVPPIAEDLVLEVSPAGEVLRERSVLEVVFAHPELKRLLWTVGHTRSTDLLHLNDVEELPTDLAAGYPTFAAGDLVLSLRYLDLVFVMDPGSGTVKWWQSGPFVEQHDPDFVGEGWISVFDNNLDGSLDGSFLGGSRLWRFRPATGERELIYPAAGSGAAPGERRFYTAMGGKAQLLPDGHWLLTEAQFGRVFEIDRDGRTVWEWGQDRHEDGRSVSEVLEGSRYPFSTETVRAWGGR
jgi:hypothetical protein